MKDLLKVLTQWQTEQSLELILAALHSVHSVPLAALPHLHTAASISKLRQRRISAFHHFSVVLSRVTRFIKNPTGLHHTEAYVCTLAHQVEWLVQFRNQKSWVQNL